ncbi:unnamed protein product [Adineta ricciae]|uniref:Uncharacterized protein n=1 Tax=Adineta ricciae TaxID=249248 RepID=A0A813ZW66_ADIRI|nr:unnamed protein product [Adineta ricciae]CAF1666717.1 unnamed protein product [Adineta ricciae]
MANITTVLEKLWRKFYQIAVTLPKNPSSYHMTMEYHQIFYILDELKLEEQRTAENIRKSLLCSRPVIISSDELEDYIKRIEFADEIMLNLDYLVKKTFDGYIIFVEKYWGMNESIGTGEQQRILSQKYDMTMSEWQFLLSKIERFHEIVKDS